MATTDEKTPHPSPLIPTIQKYGRIDRSKSKRIKLTEDGVYSSYGISNPEWGSLFLPSKRYVTGVIRLFGFLALVSLLCLWLLA